MNDTNRFKDRLKELRNEYSMTQQALANKVGIVRTAITNYETGRTIPDSETLSLISKIFNTTTDYLLGNSDIRNPYNEDTKEKYPKSTELIQYVIEEAGKQGYNLKDKSKEELAEIIVKALKIDEITKSN